MKQDYIARTQEINQEAIKYHRLYLQNKEDEFKKRINASILAGEKRTRQSHLQKSLVAEYHRLRGHQHMLTAQRTQQRNKDLENR